MNMLLFKHPIGPIYSYNKANRILKTELISKLLDIY